jgi:hypothetical protein
MWLVVLLITTIGILVGQQGTQAAQNTARLFYGPPSCIPPEIVKQEKGENS